MAHIIKGLYNTYKRKAHEDVVDLVSLRYLNFTKEGFLVNSSGFILGYCLLCFVFYSRPSTSSNDDKGFIDGMLIVLPIIFLLISNAL